VQSFAAVKKKHGKLNNVLLAFYCIHKGTMASPNHRPDSLPNAADLSFTPAQEEWTRQLMATQGTSNSASNSTATISQHQSTAEPPTSSGNLGEWYVLISAHQRPGYQLKRPQPAPTLSLTA